MSTDRLKEQNQVSVPGQAHGLVDPFRGDVLVAGTLVQNAERVANAALGEPGDLQGSVRIKLQAFLLYIFAVMLLM